MKATYEGPSIFYICDGNEKFVAACEVGDIKTVNEMIDTAEINFKNKEGDTALLEATKNGFMDIVKILLQRGADINLQDAEGWTPLMNACWYGFLDTAVELIENKANLDIQDNNGATAIMYAFNNAHFDIVKVLKDHNANIYLKDNLKMSVVSNALKVNDIEMSILFDKNIVHHQDAYGSTLLMKACEEKNERNALLLYNNGADFFIKNNKGDSAYKILKRKRKLSPVLQALKEKILLESVVNDEDSHLSLSL